MPTPVADSKVRVGVGKTAVLTRLGCIHASTVRMRMAQNRSRLAINRHTDLGSGREGNLAGRSAYAPLARRPAGDRRCLLLRENGKQQVRIACLPGNRLRFVQRRVQQVRLPGNCRAKFSNHFALYRDHLPVELPTLARAWGSRNRLRNLAVGPRRIWALIQRCVRFHTSSKSGIIDRTQGLLFKIFGLSLLIARFATLSGAGHNTSPHATNNLPGRGSSGKWHRDQLCNPFPLASQRWMESSSSD